MPMSSFCLEESPFKQENFIRLAICKTPEFFKDSNLVKRFTTLWNNSEFDILNSFNNNKI